MSTTAAKIYDKVILNDVEQRLVRHLAKKRIAYNKKVGAEETLYGARGSEENQIGYLGAELAFCKYMNVYPDLGWTEWRSEDCITYNGKRIDVKWTDRPLGRLLVKDKEWENPPDIFVLMVGIFPSYRFAGYMPAYMMLMNHRLDERLEHPAYSARQEELLTTENKWIVGGL